MVKKVLFVLFLVLLLTFVSAKEFDTTEYNLMTTNITTENITFSNGVMLVPGDTHWLNLWNGSRYSNLNAYIVFARTAFELSPNAKFIPNYVTTTDDYLVFNTSNGWWTARVNDTWNGWLFQVPEVRIESRSTGTDPLTVYASDGSALFRIAETGGGMGWLGLRDSGGTEDVVLRTDGGDNFITPGNLGIGTKNPTSMLDVYGLVNATGYLVNGTEVCTAENGLCNQSVELVDYDNDTIVRAYNTSWITINENNPTNESIVITEAQISGLVHVTNATIEITASQVSDFATAVQANELNPTNATIEIEASQVNNLAYIGNCSASNSCGNIVYFNNVSFVTSNENNPTNSSIEITNSQVSDFAAGVVANENNPTNESIVITEDQISDFGSYIANDTDALLKHIEIDVDESVFDKPFFHIYNSETLAAAGEDITLMKLDFKAQAGATGDMVGIDLGLEYDSVFNPAADNVIGLLVNVTDDSSQKPNGEVLGIKQIGDVDYNFFADELRFNDSVGQKLVLYDSGSGNRYGLGIEAFDFRIHTDGSAADISLGYGNTSAFNEEFNFDMATGNLQLDGHIDSDGTGANTFAGDVGIGTTGPSESLHIVGGKLALQNGDNNVDSISYPTLYGTLGTGGSWPFNEYGHLIYASRTNNAGYGGHHWYTANSIYAGSIDESGKWYLGPSAAAGNNKLHVNSGGNDVVARFESTDTASDILLEDGSGNMRIRNRLGELWIYTDGTTYQPFRTVNGRVRIGTSSVDPDTDFALDVRGDALGVVDGTVTPSHANGNGDLYVEQQVEFDGLASYSGFADTVCQESDGELTTSSDLCGAASPFLYAVTDSGERLPYGLEFLANLHKKGFEGTQSLNLADWEYDEYVILNKKPERDYIDMVQKVVLGSYDARLEGKLSFIVLRVNDSRLRSSNEAYVILEEGESLNVQFEPIPSDFTVISSVLRSSGWYAPYADIQQVNYTITDAKVVYEGNTSVISGVSLSADWTYADLSGTYGEDYDRKDIQEICSSRALCKTELREHFSSLIEKAGHRLVRKEKERQKEINAFDYTEDDLR